MMCRDGERVEGSRGCAVCEMRGERFEFQVPNVTRNLFCCVFVFILNVYVYYCTVLVMFCTACTNSHKID